jgi:transcriptional regulator with XRE-family HTH domain
MGYRGKVKEQEQARDLRAMSWTLQEIADKLEVSKSSVSLWVRDVEFEPRPRMRSLAQLRGPHKLRDRKMSEIEHLLAEGRDRIGQLTERDFLIAGVALYAGEGGKTDGAISFPNSDPRMIEFFLAWLRHFFNIDETRSRVRPYLHEGLDLEAALDFWSSLMTIPRSQFGKGLPGGARSEHPQGQASNGLSQDRLLLFADTPSCHGPGDRVAIVRLPSGVAQLVEQGIVNPKAAGSSPAPGAQELFEGS